MLFPVAVLQDGLGIAGCILVVMGGCVRLHFLAVFMDVSELVTVVMAGWVAVLGVSDGCVEVMNVGWVAVMIDE